MKRDSNIQNQIDAEKKNSEALLSFNNEAIRILSTVKSPSNLSLSKKPKIASRNWSTRISTDAEKLASFTSAEISTNDLKKQLKKFNINISNSSLNQYQKKGLIPRPRRVGFYQGKRGQTALYPAYTLQRIKDIKKITGQGYSLKFVRRLAGEREECDHRMFSNKSKEMVFYDIFNSLETLDEIYANYKKRAIDQNDHEKVSRITFKVAELSKGISKFVYQFIKEENTSLNGDFERKQEPLPFAELRDFVH